MQALITGVGGQDGGFLAKLLLNKGYKVFGMIRRCATNNTSNLTNILYNKNFQLIEGDLTDHHSINKIIKHTQPNELYNLAAQSHVHTSFDQPSYTFNTNTIGVLNILEAIKNIVPSCKIYQSSTSEQFGNNISPNGKFQDEQTQFDPQSPYAVAKTAAHHIVNIYRQAYGLHASCGILFNHESERRGENFVSRKITKYVAKIASGSKTHKLKLGNIYSYRDWGYAKDYVVAMWLMLQQDIPNDYVIATFEAHMVKEFLTEAFNLIGKDYINYVEFDSTLLRPAEVNYLCGNYYFAQKKLGWSPTVRFKELVKIMVESDINNESV